MGRKLTSRLRSAAYAIVSAAIVVCLLVGPLCADRCAAQACLPTSPNSPAEGCHHSSSHLASAALMNIGSGKPCALGELLYTAPRLESFTVSQRPFGAAAFFQPALTITLLPSSIDAYNSGPWTTASLHDPTALASPSIPLRT